MAGGNVIAAAGVLLVAAVVVAWPGPRASRRLAVVTGQGLPRSVGWLSMADVREWGEGLWQRLAAAPRRATLAAGGAAAALGLSWQGPVAGCCAALYGAVLARAALDRQARRADEAGHARLESTLGALAADLRAGASPQHAVAACGLLGSAADEATPTAIRALADVPGQRTALRLAAAWQVAEATGAGLATVLERLEADLAAARRRRARTTAEAAGASATSRLLAALPVAGVAMGYALSADPLEMLLHTPVGAVCCFAAVLLQCAGLRWSRRIVETAGRAS